MSSLLRTLGWAAYLGMSWTWCIGMFLPVLLMRDFGAWGYVVFAVPNVVGAAGMGWVLRHDGSAERLRRDHAGAIAWFALVTIAFHIFWFFWLCAIYGLDLVPAISIAAAILVAVAKLSEKRDHDRTLLAAAVLAFSLAAMAVFFAMGWARPIVSGPTRPTTEVWWLAPVCMFGFAFCPYLDPTFLQARSRAPGASGTAAFVVGFGVFFLLMILFTFAYAGYVRTSRHDASVTAPTVPILTVIGAHWFAQLVFTFHVQAREAIRTIKGEAPSDTPKPAMKSRRRWPLWGVAVVFVLAIFYVPAYHGLALGEVIYRCFMAFYGLVFPTYVWLCMIPTRDGHAGTGGERGRWKLRVLLGAVVIAMPFYWMGFIERQTWFLAPGLGVVLLSRLVVMGRRRVRPGEEGEVSVRGGL